MKKRLFGALYKEGLWEEFFALSTNTPNKGQKKLRVLIRYKYQIWSNLQDDDSDKLMRLESKPSRAFGDKCLLNIV